MTAITGNNAELIKWIEELRNQDYQDPEAWKDLIHSLPEELKTLQRDSKFETLERVIQVLGNVAGRGGKSIGSSEYLQLTSP